MKLFDPILIGNVILKNRIIRSATFEGMADKGGYPTGEFLSYYTHLAAQNIGGIITGFMFISKEGKAMHPGQIGIDDPAKIPYLQQVTEAVHELGGKIFAQIAHTGRQTKTDLIGAPVVGVSTKKSFYFNEVPHPLATAEVFAIADQFALAGLYAKEAGFDGIQLHAAHGYLIHQFLIPSINDRFDLFKVDPKTAIGTKFLETVIERTREKCGADFPILIKISGSDDYFKRFSLEQYINLIRFLDQMKVAAIEVSYGTMDYALNIFRGEIPVELICQINPVYRIENCYLRSLWKIIFVPLMRIKIKPFTPLYNRFFAKLAKEHTKIPIICVGGIRTGKEMRAVIDSGDVDLVSLCRPFLCEPNLVDCLKLNPDYVSKCTNCNFCAIMCDSGECTRCYQMRR